MNVENKDHFPWDEIPDTDVLETGNYLVVGKELEDGQSGRTGNRMFKAQIQVTEPIESKGMCLFENFVTGTGELPGIIVPSTMGSKRLKRIFTAAQVPASNNIEKMCKQFEGSAFGISVSCYEEKGGDYPGLKNKITSFWKLGEKVPGVQAAKKPGGFAGNRAADLMPPPVTAPVQQAQQVQQTQAPIATPPVSPAPQQVAPTVTAPVQASIATPPVETPAPAQLLNPIPCNICGEMVEMENFAAHLQQCAANQGVTQ